MPLAPTYTDPELRLRIKAAKAVNRDSVEELCQLLRGRQWTTAAELLGLRPDWPRGEQGKRFVRLLANAARPRILSAPGSHGYRLADPSNLEEIQHAANAHRSQARDHLRSYIKYSRYASKLRDAARMLEATPQ